MQIINWSAFSRLVKPSFGGGWATFIASVVIVAVLSLPALYRKLGIDLYFVALEKGELESDVFGQYQYISDVINSSKLAADISTFVVWAVIGLIAFFLVINVFRFFNAFVSFFRRMNNAFVNRKALVEEALIHLAIRGLTIGLIVGLYRLFMELLLPFLIVLTGSVINSPWHLAILYAVISLFIVSMFIHLVFVVIRLIKTDPESYFNRSSILR